MAAWRAENPDATRGHDLKRRYGISREDFEERLAAQDGLCAICRELPATDVDHHHASGRVPGAVRGLLCGRCNRGIGHFKDEPDMLRDAADYVEKFNNLQRET